MSRNGDMIQYNIHDIVQVQTNRNIDRIIPPIFRVNKTTPDFRIHIGDFEVEQNEDNKSLYYEFRHGPLTSKLLIKSIAGNTELKVKRMLPLSRKISKIAFDLISAILEAKLLLEKHWLVHSACISRNGEGIMVFAPPETGKTLTILSLIKNYGFSFLSDDMTIIDGTHAYSYPTAPTLHSYHIKALNVKLSRKERLKLKIPTLWTPSKGLTPDLLKFQEYMDIKLHVKNRVKLNTIYILERGKPNITKIDEDEAFEKIMTSGRMHIFLYENPLIMSYAYNDPSFNLQELFETEERICKTLIDESECFVVRHDNKGYDHLIAKSVG